jgi:hypothetical protein
MRNDRIPCRRRLGRPRIAIFLAIVTVALPATHAQALRVRLRWLPSPDADVLGYRIYVRQAFRTYAAPVADAMPRPAADGTMSWVVGGLPSTQTSYVAISAYSSESESWLSREVAIGETDPCVIDRCSKPALCEFGVQDDGVSCGEGHCEVCRFARCTTIPPVALDTTARINRKGEIRARLRGRFVPNGPFDPTSTGIALRVGDTSGRLLLETAVPASAFKASVTRNRFRLVDRDTLYGIRRFNLWFAPGRARISMLVQGNEFAPLADDIDLAWALRFGSDQCAVDPDLVCTRARCQ